MTTVHQKSDITLLAKVLILFASAVAYIVYLSVFSVSAGLAPANCNSLKITLSVLGLFELILIFCSWRLVKPFGGGLYLTLVLFLFVFNFGQCVLWAFGVHYEGDIGSSTLYTLQVIPSDYAIVRAQIYILTSLLLLHCGAVFACSTRGRQNVRSEMAERDLQIVFSVVKYASIIIVPITLFVCVRTAWLNQTVGYGANLYGGFGSSSMNLILYAYMPCLFGLLIGSKYETRTARVVYALLIVYIILSILSGDRGTWVPALFVFFWLHVVYKGRPKLSLIIAVLLGGFILAVGLSLLRDFRATGFDAGKLGTIVNSYLIGDNNPIVALLAEAGSNMKIVLVFLQDPVPHYPYGNSYLLAIPGMFTEKIIRIFQPEYISVGTWFDRQYLGISYGAGFSAFAEPLMNFGTAIAPLVMAAFGAISCKIMNITESDKQSRPLKMFAAASIAPYLFLLSRNTFLAECKSIFWGVLTLFFIMLTVRSNSTKQLGETTLEKNKGLRLEF